MIRTGIEAPLSQALRFLFSEKIDGDLVSLAKTGVAVEKNQVCPIVVTLGCDSPIHALPLAVGAGRQVGWPPNVVQPGVVVRVVEFGDNRPP